MPLISEISVYSKLPAINPSVMQTTKIFGEKDARNTLKAATSVPMNATGLNPKRLSGQLTNIPKNEKAHK